MKTIFVQIEQQKKEYPEHTTYLEIAREYQESREYPIVLVNADGRLRELKKEAEDGAELSFITTAQKAGHCTYVRSLLLLMLRAIRKEAGEDAGKKQAEVHFIVSDGLYCTLRDRKRPTAEFLEAVKKRMQDMAEQKVSIGKKSIATYEAVKKFSDYEMWDKEQLFRYRRVSRVNLYELDGFEDYFYGYMLPDTSYLKQFDLKPFEDGFVLLYPTMENPKELPEFRPEMKIYQVQKDSMIWGEKLQIPTVGALNDLIVRQNIKDLILIQEAYHEKKIAEIAAMIAEHPEKRIVLIAGPSSSGKTTFSHRLSTQLSVYGLCPHPIPVDDYFVEREQTPRDENGNYNFECLEAIDTKTFNRDMKALLAGETVELPVFNFKTGKREYKGKYEKLGEHDILVIEGIHCLNDKLTIDLPPESKFKIYISALTQLNVDEHNRIPTTDGRLLRRIVRDARTRGADATRTINMWPSVRNGEENYIFPYQEEADVMFNSALIYELAVLKLYAEPLLFSVQTDQPEYQEAKRLLKFLDYFLPIPPTDIPNQSLIREFIGGGCFDL